MNLRAERTGLVAGFRLVADVHADDVGAFAREREGDGLANAPARAGDDGHFVFESFMIIFCICNSDSPVNCAYAVWLV